MSWVFFLTVVVRRVASCTDPKEHTNDHQSNFHASVQRSFPQDTNHLCASVDRSVGTVSDSRMKAHCNCPESPRLVRQLTRHFHSRLHRLVDARAPSGNSRHSVVCHCVCDEGSSADRKVAWSTNRDSTQNNGHQHSDCIDCIKSSP